MGTRSVRLPRENRRDPGQSKGKFEMRGDSSMVEHPVPPGEGGSIPTSPLQSPWNIVSISKKEAEAFVLAKHYSHRASIFWAAFGLVIGDKIEGVVVYGQPSPPIQKVVQATAKNAASFLVGQSLHRLEKPSAVVSYADEEWGHVGIVYQATNWLYTGATKSHDHAYIVDGKRVHPITLRDKGISDPKRWAKENGIETVAPMPKHRYFFLTGSARDKKKMLAKMAYPVLSEYPKAAKRMYDSGPRIEMAPASQNSTLF
jgi:hypothetical protein